MNLKEAMEALKEGKSVRRKRWAPGDYLWVDEDKVLRNFSFINFTYDLITSDDWEIVKEPVLKDGEKAYLENLLRPYVEKYGKILMKKLSGDEKCHPSIWFYKSKDDKTAFDSIFLPTFGKDEYMYNGMKPNKLYTLDELGLNVADERP